MIEARALLWLRWRQFQGGLHFWLAALDYDTRNHSLLNRLYSLYLFAIVVGWMAIMWSYAAGAALAIASGLPFSLRETVASGLPPLVAVLLGVAIALAFRSSPFRLSLPDTAYVAGSPMPRVTATTLGFLGATFRLVAVSAFLAPLTAGVLAEPLGATGVAASAAQTTLAVVLLTVLATGLAWLAGLVPVVWPSARWLRAGWFLSALLVVPAYLAPGVALGPGRVLVAALLGEATGVDFLALAGTALAALVALVWLARGVDLRAVADESAAFARIGALGLASWSSPDLAQRIRAQNSLASRRRLARLADVQWTKALVARAGLSYVRHPTTLIWAVLGCVGFAQAGSRLLLSQTALLTLGVAWVAAMVLRPPRSLVDGYRSDVANPFVFQLLRVDRLTLLLADTAIPLALVGAATLGLEVAQRAPLATGGVEAAFALVIALLMALCQGVGLVEPIVGGVRLSYVRIAVVVYVVLLLAAAVSGGPAPLLGSAVALALALGRIAARAGVM